jgi:arabinogalactan oligomer/maltooligosaccharide transport system permease protein
MAGILWKLGVLGVVDAVAVTMIMILLAQNRIWVAVLSVAVLLIVNWIYLRKGGLPAKYLTPGVLFLLVFQVYVLLFSGYTAFTNYGSAHNGDESLAIQTIKNAAYRTLDGEDYSVGLVKSDATGHEALLLTSNLDQKVYIGEDGKLLVQVPSGGYTLSPKCADPYAEDVTTCMHAAEKAVGYSPVPIDSLSPNQKLSFASIRVATDLANPNVGIKTADFASALQVQATLSYSDKTGFFTAIANDDYGNYVTGDVFKPATDGYFHIDGDVNKAKLDGGWRVEVGFANFQKIFTDVQLREPLIKVITWTFAFAFLTVLSTFVLGLLIAFLFNHEKLRGKKFYRAIMILPYAFPGFLSAYVWVGLFNRENGFINTVILGQTPGNEGNFGWLLEENPARLAVLLVNLWLGFPYMFLITTGALQSIPSELNEAAEIDGASS